MPYNANRLTPPPVVEMMLAKLPELPPGIETILDAAAGPGIWGHILKKRRLPTAHMTGIDSSDAYANEDQRLSGFDEWINDDFIVRSKTIPDKAYDAVISNPPFNRLDEFIEVTRRVSNMVQIIFMSTGHIIAKERYFSLIAKYRPAMLVILAGKLRDQGGSDMNGRCLLYWDWFEQPKITRVEWVGSTEPRDYQVKRYWGYKEVEAQHPTKLKFRVMADIGADTRYMLVDQNSMVWISGQPFGMMVSVISEHRRILPKTEEDAWNNAPTGVEWGKW